MKRKKIIRLTESDITRLIKKIIKEEGEDAKMSLITSLKGFISLLEKPEANVQEICKTIVDTCSNFKNTQVTDVAVNNQSTGDMSSGDFPA